MTGRIVDSFPQTRSLPARAIRLGLKARIFSGGTPDKSNLDFWERGELPWIGSGEVNQRHITVPTAYITEEAVRNSATKLFPIGSVAMALAGQGKTKATVATMGIDAYGNQSLACISDYAGDSKFLFWWLNSLYREIRGLSSQDTRDGLNQSMVGQIPVPDYDLETQKAIASFLDRETDRIDQLIEKKMRLAELLNEKQHSSTERLVAFGLSETSEKVETDNIWLPLVAKGTRLLPIKRVARLLNGYAFSSDDLGAVGVPVIRIGDVGPTINTEAAKKFTGDPSRSLEQFVVRKGDILIAMTGATIGKFGVYDSDTRAYLNQRVGILRARGINGSFLSACLATRTFVEQMKLFAYGGAQPNIGASEIGSILIPVPSPKVQNAIVDVIGAQAEHLNSLKIAIQNSIDRLREFRAAIVTAAVTGQIDVLTWGKQGQTDRRLEQIEEDMSLREARS